MARNAVTSEDVVLFRRDASQDHPATGLTLWGTEDGYYVPNIVPLEILPRSVAETLPVAFAEWLVSDNTVDQEQSIEIIHSRRC